jgi:hypothetical protein
MVKKRYGNNFHTVFSFPSKLHKYLNGRVFTRAGQSFFALPHFNALTCCKLQHFIMDIANSLQHYRNPYKSFIAMRSQNTYHEITLNKLLAIHTSHLIKSQSRAGHPLQNCPTAFSAYIQHNFDNSRYSLCCRTTRSSYG